MNEICLRLFDSEPSCNWTSVHLGWHNRDESHYGPSYFYIKIGKLMIYSWTNHRWFYNLGCWFIRRQQWNARN